MAAGCSLHLIRPLGFDTSEKACRRAGLDYWPRLSPIEHDGFDDYLRVSHPERLWLFTTKTSRPVWQADLARGDHLVFGRETRGLPADLLERYPDRLLTLPMLPTERSLNLATAVCAVVYEGIRQLVANGQAALDASGRILEPASANPARAR
jgi:tRNA (cytidine/uridine-2'-O-)-methyltransferase